MMMWGLFKVVYDHLWKPSLKYVAKISKAAGSPGNAMPGPFASGHKPCLGAGVESLFKAADW